MEHYFNEKLEEQKKEIANIKAEANAAERRIQQEVREAEKVGQKALKEQKEICE